MTTRQLLLTSWHLHPSVLLGVAALLLGYLAALRFRPGARAILYVSGIAVLFVALASPLHVLGDGYLFSAHMLQHLLMTLIVPPLLIGGLPPALVERALRQPHVATVERVLRQPLIALGLGTAALWIWHLPALYNAALGNQPVHIVEHLFFIGTAIILWWPVLAPVPASRLAPPAALLYIFGAMAASTPLGIILTFAEPGWYPAYLRPPDGSGIVQLLRGGWGLTPAVDQQLGGLLMWIPGNAVYFGAFLAALVRWFNAPDDDAEHAATAAPLRSVQKHV